MSTTHREKLKEIRTFPSLIKYLRDDMNWPIEGDSFEEITFDYTPEELGIDFKNAVKIEEIKRLRPLSTKQPWGIFFVKFAPGPLPVVALRRILSRVALKKRASANSSERAAWKTDDLLFISNYGEGSERHITFAHFSQDSAKNDLPTLKVLGWDNLDTPLHLDSVSDQLTHTLSWPDDAENIEGWRKTWSSAFLLRHREVIQTSENLSIQLAHLARAIRDRIVSALTIETDSGPLTKLLKAFKETLVHDLNIKSFADMYAQTIAYGLLSARIANPKGATADELATQMPVTNPFLKELMETFLQVGGRKRKGGPNIDFDELGINEVVELLDDANMDAVIRDFGDKNPQEDPVIHFYELFLKEYDAEKRMQRGVFYTPRPIVSYIVRSVDELLKTSLKLPDGLADPITWGEMIKANPGMNAPKGINSKDFFVQILDPATGTGTFLVEVIGTIHETMCQKWKKQGKSEGEIITLWNEYVPKYLLSRIFGFELLMAPYAIAHLKIGIKLYETGYRFKTDKCVHVYLTNSLEHAEDDKKDSLEGILPALAHEAETVNTIKKSQSFTIIIGNPPYASTSSNLTDNLRKIVDPYRFVNGERIRERSMLQFEKNIQDDYIKFIAFSQSTLDAAGVGIMALITNHSYLDGPTLRGVRHNLLSRSSKCWLLDLHGNLNKGEVPPANTLNEPVFDIRQGVSILTCIKYPQYQPCTTPELYSVWGSRTEKYNFLSNHTLLSSPFERIQPETPYFFFIPPDLNGKSSEWDAWPSVAEVFSKRSTGTESGYDDLLVGFTRAEVKERVAQFSNPNTPKNQLSEEFDFTEGHAAELYSRRKELQSIKEEELLSFQLRAYDYRIALLRKNLLKTNSFNVMLDLSTDSPGLVTTRQTKEKFSAFAVKSFCGHKVTSSYDRGYVFPLFTRHQDALFQTKHSCINSKVLEHFKNIVVEKRIDDERLTHEVFAYMIAAMNSSSYASNYHAQLKRDYPHIPLLSNPELFHKLSELGRSLISIQLMESPTLNKYHAVFIGNRNKEIEKISFKDNTVWIDKSQTTGFKGIIEPIWSFQIGGYQVCEKWLKDRKDRKLSKDDIDHYQKILLAISETIRITSEIDKSIDKYGGWPKAFE